MVMPLKPPEPQGRNLMLTEQQRMEIAVLRAVRLWSRETIAKAYGVSAKTVTNCYVRYFPNEYIGRVSDG